MVPRIRKGHSGRMSFFDFVMSCFCYILYSVESDRYYIGETDDLEERLSRHKSGFFRQSYTARSGDWEVFLALPCINRVHARKVEKHIKSMKSREYIKNLKKYPELRSKLLKRFSDKD